MKRFLFYVPAQNSPSGGVNVILEIANALRNCGIEAEVICSEKTFKYDFLPSAPAVHYAPQIREPMSRLEQLRSWLPDSVFGRHNDTIDLRPTDIVVVPEYVSDWLPRCFARQLCVLFNQNFHALARTMLVAGWDRERFAATVSISEACDALARLMKLPRSYAIPLEVSGGPSGSNEKKKVIAFMPRKRPLEVQMVTKLLRDRGNIQDFELRALDGLPREKVTAELRETSIFLSFSESEGFGLPPAEAMLAACVVVGFTGVGGAEFFDAEVGFPVEDGNIMDFVVQVEQIAELCRRSDPTIERIRSKASQRIAERYGPKRHVAEVRRVFGELANAL